MAQVGDRVVALRNADDTTVFLYGRGTYLGHLPVPYWDPDVVAVDGKTWRATVEETVRFEMEQPQVEWVHQGRPTGVDQHANPMGDTRTFEQRVADRLDKMAGNPCIELDGGAGRVWGYFCWWAPEVKYEKLRAGRVEAAVPVPYPLPHSLLTL
jgi:hypothetical protein